MAGNRELGEVQSHPVDDSFTADDSGYLLEAKQDGSNEVQMAVSGSGNALIGHNFVSTEDQWEDVVNPDSGEIDVVEEGELEVKGEAEEYFKGDDVYVSTDNDGHVSKADSGNRRIGRVAEYTDNSGGAVGDKVPVKFDYN